ncbi:probable chitinase 2 [Anoplophora glabripennis]|uniref:probable chitinase 2 n=1 Tax=Anoplophora glabripennis TaxID=217634 RepID=UPI0008736743|nr:probable chitinase 2 [Anoplophora glabripennis]
MWFNKCVCVLLGFFVNVPVLSFNTGPAHEKLVVCYLGSWSVYRPGRGSFTIEHLEPSLCTHVIYSFAGLSVKNNSIRSLDPWQDLTEDHGKSGYQRITMLRNRYPHLKVTLAIGGWNEGSSNYSQLAANPVRRSEFVSNALEFVKKYHFDGLDLDWEFPGKRGGTPEDKLNFLLLVKELRAAFRKHNLLLTAAFGAGKDTIDGGYDVEGLSLYLDFIHMMCYDYHGTWDGKTGANAPLRSSDDVFSDEYSINYMLKLGAPASKLVMGIPLYGRTFILEDPISPSPKRKPRLGAIAGSTGFQGPYTRENGFMGYNEICVELKNTTAGWKTYWDEQSRTPFAATGNQLISYDNEQSIAEKVQFAMEKGLAGIMVWSVDTDDFHGDCSDGDDETFVNFPLMRCINKSIIQSLKYIENTISQKKELGAGSVSKNIPCVIVVMLAIAFSLIR